ncbi:MAG: 30S ribosomal protein S9 [Deltaproteobacteria bacterium]|nr:MAG: 30S ribosomal protein S9 [Deltaproteobacteria bacterium]
MTKDSIYYATGRRKTSVARTWIEPGSGNIYINNKPVETYFGVKRHSESVMEPLQITDKISAFNVKVSVKGGGMTGQAEAARHGISQALIKFDPELRDVLKKAGFVRRDPRMKERKKYGQKGARASFQFSKR